MCGEHENDEEGEEEEDEASIIQDDDTAFRDIFMLEFDMFYVT